MYEKHMADMTVFPLPPHVRYSLFTLALLSPCFLAPPGNSGAIWVAVGLQQGQASVLGGCRAGLALPTTGRCLNLGAQ